MSTITSRSARSFLPWILLLVAPAVGGEVPFDGSTQLASLGAAVSAVAGDLDGDGDLDLLVGGQGSGVHWLENDGSTGPWSAHELHATFDTRHLALADLDGDGDLDALGAAFSGALTWWENPGPSLVTGAWAATAFETSPGVPFEEAFGVAAADLDGDGDLDVVATNGGLAWWENTNGDGSAWTYTVISPVNAAARVAVVDFDRDGDLDLVTAGGDALNSVCWYENLGTGASWTRHTLASGLAFGVSHASAGDLDGDGDPDVLASIGTDDSGGGELAWFEADGTRHNVDLGAHRTQWSAAADVDGDGDLDIVATFWSNGPTPGYAAWWENFTGDGTAWVMHPLEELHNGMQGSVADVDGDGDPDLALARLGEVRLFRNRELHRSASHNFTPALADPPHREPVATGLTHQRFLEPGDIDGDGHIDLVSASGASASTTTTLWWENPGPGGGSWTPHDLGGGNDAFTGGLALGDIDGSGALDIVLARNGDIEIFLDPGPSPRPASAAMSAPVRVSAPTGGGPGTGLALADLDRDGDLDLFFGYWNPPESIVWWENSGTLVFTEHIIEENLTFPDIFHLSAADIDGDGDLDVVGLADGRVAWWENELPATTWTRHDVDTAFETREVAAVDLDGDGDLDLAAADRISGDLALWLNADGAGTTWTKLTIATAVFSSARRTLAADLDGDGDPDLVVTEAVGDRVTRWENRDGGATWVARDVAIGVENPRCGPPADLDGDGKLDIAVLYGETTIDYYRDEGGQFAIPAADAVSSPTPPEGAQAVLLLELEGAHRGRAGDGDARLVGLTLLFEEAAGDPLADAEATALIDDVEIFVDDGDGVYEPDTDDIELLSIGAPFGLDAGELALVLPDTEAGFLFSPGVPRTWWLAVNLAADGGSATPNAFRVSRLGAEGKVALMAGTSLELDDELEQDAASATLTVAIAHTLSITVAGDGEGNVTSDPAGIDCGSVGSACAADFAAGTLVELTPAPETGSLFGGWSGDADCADGEVTLSAAVACTATFVPIEIFADGFESGDLLAWSSHTPP